MSTVCKSVLSGMCSPWQDRRLQLLNVKITRWYGQKLFLETVDLKLLGFTMDALTQNLCLNVILAFLNDPSIDKIKINMAIAYIEFFTKIFVYIELRREEAFARKVGRKLRKTQKTYLHDRYRWALRERKWLADLAHRLLYDTLRFWWTSSQDYPLFVRKGQGSNSHWQCNAVSSKYRIHTLMRMRWSESQKDIFVKNKRTWAQYECRIRITRNRPIE